MESVPILVRLLSSAGATPVTLRHTAHRSGTLNGNAVAAATR
jgi:hypothetical protein